MKNILIIALIYHSLNFFPPIFLSPQSLSFPSPSNSQTKPKATLKFFLFFFPSKLAFSALKLAFSKPLSSPPLFYTIDISCTTFIYESNTSLSVQSFDLYKL